MDGLVDMFHFIIVRVRLAVGTYESVDAEIAIVRHIAEVTAVCPELVVMELEAA